MDGKYGLFSDFGKKFICLYANGTSMLRAVNKKNETRSQKCLFAESYERCYTTPMLSSSTNTSSSSSSFLLLLLTDVRVWRQLRTYGAARNLTRPCYLRYQTQKQTLTTDCRHKYEEIECRHRHHAALGSFLVQ